MPLAFRFVPMCRNGFSLLHACLQSGIWSLFPSLLSRVTSLAPDCPHALRSPFTSPVPLTATTDKDKWIFTQSYQKFSLIFVRWNRLYEAIKMWERRQRQETFFYERPTWHAVISQTRPGINLSWLFGWFRAVEGSREEGEADRQPAHVLCIDGVPAGENWHSWGQGSSAADTTAALSRVSSTAAATMNLHGWCDSTGMATVFKHITL